MTRRYAAPQSSFMNIHIFFHFLHQNGFHLKAKIEYSGFWMNNPPCHLRWFLNYFLLLLIQLAFYYSCCLSLFIWFHLHLFFIIVFSFLLWFLSFTLSSNFLNSTLLRCFEGDRAALHTDLIRSKSLHLQHHNDVSHWSAARILLKQWGCAVPSLLEMSPRQPFWLFFTWHWACKIHSWHSHCSSLKLNGPTCVYLSWKDDSCKCSNNIHVTIWWETRLLFFTSFLGFHLLSVVKADRLWMELSVFVLYFSPAVPVVTVGLFVHLNQQVLGVLESVPRTCSADVQSSDKALARSQVDCPLRFLSPSQARRTVSLGLCQVDGS